ncbi:hypothetical protein GWO43_10475 [candidate division KSB1 bacterium]|nr:hypothetical protein [candidate division KSB1 bacterium]NIV69200.1 hypothetical protein [Phycisphaerae bacterium]NIT71300.1 hypothetical protein [candidate division KSB1 bacterium]NIU25479.1 hypothetical protein [candidate division KSB1 bacterium]NIU89543.1 hypothetical protein [candidate division KSB1 bacterium]
MQKRKTIYDSPLDAIVALAKRLSIYEEKYNRASEDFFDNFNKGLLYDDRIDFIEGSNDYQHFLSLKSEFENRLTHVT